MNKLLSQAMAWVQRWQRGCQRPLSPRYSAFVIPSSPRSNLSAIFCKCISVTTLTGAQNMHEADQGAWTGKISAAMLAETGATLTGAGTL
ncbi:triose-phosphate isomerase [Klebsiella variicola subsp. variicola]|nr:triose-phosphate isomerase [Klebsiella variicola subsp. variicola]